MKAGAPGNQYAALDRRPDPVTNLFHQRRLRRPLQLEWKSGTLALVLRMRRLMTHQLGPSSKHHYWRCAVAGNRRGRATVLAPPSGSGHGDEAIAAPASPPGDQPPASAWYKVTAEVAF